MHCVGLSCSGCLPSEQSPDFFGGCLAPCSFFFFKFPIVLEVCLASSHMFPQIKIVQRKNDTWEWAEFVMSLLAIYMGICTFAFFLQSFFEAHFVRSRVNCRPTCHDYGIRSGPDWAANATNFASKRIETLSWASWKLNCSLSHSIACVFYAHWCFGVCPRIFSLVMKTLRRQRSDHGRESAVGQSGVSNFASVGLWLWPGHQLLHCALNTSKNLRIGKLRAWGALLPGTWHRWVCTAWRGEKGQL